MSESKDPSFEVVLRNGNRELVVKSGPFRPLIDFPVNSMTLGYMPWRFSLKLSGLLFVSSLILS